MEEVEEEAGEEVEAGEDSEVQGQGPMPVQPRHGALHFSDVLLPVFFQCGIQRMGGPTWWLALPIVGGWVGLQVGLLSPRCRLNGEHRV